uniref:NADH-ubiquinone oxidoreductase chain 2 n=1 Tax=Scirtes sp. 2 ACP-2013 TaxID=1434573 RepID=A0A3G4RY94_9COLE|nr:NADH dehydrogenase subunit 2 [Scirtes sp. 2 ACP-2013]
MYKALSFSILMISTLISISSSSWMGAWMGLEINLISFIPLISNSKNVFSSESSMKYFIVQALASSALLFSILSLMNINESSTIKPLILMILNSAILMKMGAAPFHFWFPEIMNKINWSQSMILLTWQKLAPMSLISYSIKMSNFMITIILLSALIGSIIGLNQTSLLKIMAYSSINHMSWMLSSMIIKEMIWMIYFITYSILSISLIMIMKNLNVFFLNQLFISLNNNPLTKFSFIINFLSLGGLPPFLGFFPKWMIIQNLIMENLYILSLLLIMFTLISLFFYLRVTFSSMSIMYQNIKWKTSNKMSKFSLYLANSSSLMGLTLCTMIYSMI